jgi:antitoxin component YwqK of YwqJK toxin-antitoxin module
MHIGFRSVALMFALAAPGLAQAVQSCELNGQPVNTSNGNTTAGKTGLIRCRDAEGGPVVREEELQNGKFMGVVRRFREGVLEREHSVNEKGNREGRAREFAATAGATNQMLRDETLRNGTTVGLARSWLANGTLKRVSFHGDDGREQAVAEFTPQAKLADLRCGPQPLLAPDADDATWCGHRGKGPATVELFSADGAVRGRLTHERGERRKIETLWESGKLREETVIDSTGGSERRYSAEGVKRRELVWVTQVTEGRSARITTLEQEFHESGTLVHERRWLPVERGGELQLEQHWYLNGQLRDKIEYIKHEGQSARRETRYFDNGRISSEGLWFVKGRYDNQATGTHKGFDDQGRLRSERFYDARGRVNRERELDEAGRVLRDEELFEDGSRKAFTR